MAGDRHIDIDYFQIPKHGQRVAGDGWFSTRLDGEDRVIAVLADGMGSGIKAGVLATLTGTMAMTCVARDMPADHVARAIAEILPVCRERKMAYSTFSIVDIDRQRRVRLIEHENPPCLLIRDGAVQRLERKTLPLPSHRDAVPSATRALQEATFEARSGDRLILVSDGVTQSGISPASPGPGWGDAALARFVLDLIRHEPDMAARTLARRIVRRACFNDGGQSGDDTTCAVINFRSPRRLLIATGPPMRRESDADLVDRLMQFDGRKVLAGGTTADIVARLLNRRLTPDLKPLHDGIPPAAHLHGFDLVTEGMITLTAVAALLEQDVVDLPPGDNPALALAALMLDSDVIEFIVGTRINDTLVAPDVPVYMDIRRNLVDRLCRALRAKHCKTTRVEYI